MDPERKLYIIRFEEENYSPIKEIITKHNANIRRKYVDSKDVELIIHCNSNFIKEITIKDVEIIPYARI